MPQDRPLQAEYDVVRIPILGETKGVKSSSGYSQFTDFFNCWPEINRHPSTGEESYVIQRFPSPAGTGTVGNMPADIATTYTVTATNQSPIAHMAMSQMSNVMIAVFIDKTSGTMYVNTLLRVLPQ
jgi:hypothetical protein